MIEHQVSFENQSWGCKVGTLRAVWLDRHIKNSVLVLDSGSDLQREHVLRLLF